MAWSLADSLTWCHDRWYSSHPNPCSTNQGIGVSYVKKLSEVSTGWLALWLGRLTPDQCMRWNPWKEQNLMRQLEVENLGARSSIILYILILYCINNIKQQATKAQPVSLSTLWIRFCTHLTLTPTPHPSWGWRGGGGRGLTSSVCTPTDLPHCSWLSFVCTNACLSAQVDN